MPYCCRLSVDGLENEKMLEAAVLLVCVLLPGTTSYSYRNIWERFHYASSRKKKSDYCVQLSSVAESCPTLCDPMDCSMQGFPVHHQLPELAQTCPSSLWCHPAISSSVIPFSSCLQSFPASGSFQMSQFFTSGGQSFGVSVQHQSFQWIFKTDLL